MKRILLHFAKVFRLDLAVREDRNTFVVIMTMLGLGLCSMLFMLFVVVGTLFVRPPRINSFMLVNSTVCKGGKLSYSVAGAVRRPSVLLSNEEVLVLPQQVSVSIKPTVTHIYTFPTSVFQQQEVDLSDLPEGSYEIRIAWRDSRGGEPIISSLPFHIEDCGTPR